MFVNKLCVRKTANTNVPVCLAWCSSETAALLGFITVITGKCEFPTWALQQLFVISNVVTAGPGHGRSDQQHLNGFFGNKHLLTGPQRKECHVKLLCVCVRTYNRCHFFLFPTQVARVLALDMCLTGKWQYYATIMLKRLLQLGAGQPFTVSNSVLCIPLCKDTAPPLSWASINRGYITEDSNRICPS